MCTAKCLFFNFASRLAEASILSKVFKVSGKPAPYSNLGQFDEEGGVMYFIKSGLEI